MKPLPLKEFYKHKSGDLMMHDQVSLVIISCYKESYSVKRLYDKIFIGDRIANSRPIVESDFNAAYVLAMSHCQIYKIG